MLKGLGPQIKVQNMTHVKRSLNVQGLPPHYLMCLQRQLEEETMLKKEIMMKNDLKTDKRWVVPRVWALLQLWILIWIKSDCKKLFYNSTGLFWFFSLGHCLFISFIIPPIFIHLSPFVAAIFESLPTTNFWWIIYHPYNLYFIFTELIIFNLFS